MERAGLLTGVAFWHEPELGAATHDTSKEDCCHGEVPLEVPPHAQVRFLPGPRAVAAGDRTSILLRFEDHELQLIFPD